MGSPGDVFRCTHPCIPVAGRGPARCPRLAVRFYALEGPRPDRGRSVLSARCREHWMGEGGWREVSPAEYLVLGVMSS